MIQHETLTNNSDKSRLVDATGSQASGSRTIEEDLGTMVIIFILSYAYHYKPRLVYFYPIFHWVYNQERLILQTIYTLNKEILQ